MLARVARMFSHFHRGASVSQKGKTWRLMPRDGGPLLESQYKKNLKWRWCLVKAGNDGQSRLILCIPSLKAQVVQDELVDLAEKS